MGVAAETKPQLSFKYVAKDENGKTVRGVVEAMSARGARTAVMERALEPVKVREKTGFNVQVSSKRVKPTELMHFSRQLAAFVRAGIPILDAIEALAEGMDNPTMQKALYDMNDALRAGESFTDSLLEHPKVFPPFYTGVISASEHTGNLDAALDRLSEYIERDVENRRKVKSAFAYPSVILVFAFFMVILLTVFVMPRFESFFASLGAQLPLPTRILVGTMGFLTSWWPVLGAGVVAVTAGWMAFVKTATGEKIKDTLLLKLPGIGGIVHTAVVERFCRTLGSMIEAAVPLPEALNVASEGTNNVIFKTKLSGARDLMIQGEGIASPIIGTGLFPTAATQMIKAGEHTGTLERQLVTAADYFEKELDYRLKQFTAMFEPIVIIFAGGIVGFVAVAMVSAMYGIFGQV